jgi:septal ring factor EnvC (AmiA/AmiB activator)
MTVKIILAVLLVLVLVAFFALSAFYKKHRNTLQNIIHEKDEELKKANQTIESEKNKAALRDRELKQVKDELSSAQQKLRMIEENTVEVQVEVPENLSAHQAISKLLMSSIKTVKAGKLCGKRTTETGTVWSLKILK